MFTLEVTIAALLHGIFRSLGGEAISVLLTKLRKRTGGGNERVRVAALAGD